MSTETTLRPVHVVAAETGAHRVSELASVLDTAGRVSHPHVLPPEVVTRAGDEGAEERLRQELELVNEAARAALADGGLLLLVDGRAALVVPEMMRILMDEQGKGWAEAWRATTQSTLARLGSPGDQPGPLWSADLLEETCPRLLEIIYEINRRHLAEVEARWPGDVDRQRNTSLFREGDLKRLRLGVLAIIGAGRADMARPWGEGPLGEIMAHLNESRDGALRPRPTQVSARRWLDEGNPAMSEVLTLALGERWRSEPETLDQLETLAFDPAFRGAFRNARRANRERLAGHLRDTLGLETDTDALVDVTLGVRDGRERLILVVLGLIREHLRITAGGWTPPAPRTVVIGCRTGAGDPYAVRALAVGGAVTLGTRDGTVREIEEAVGEENMFLFGLGPHEARAWREGRVYRPRDVYTIDPLVRRALDELVSTRYAPEAGAHDWVRDSLLDAADPWLVLADFGEYVHRQDEVLAEFADPRAFTEKAILTLARSRRFWSRPLELDP